MQSLPLFYLSFFRMLKESKKIMRTFLWGGTEGANKIAWVKWDTVCKPKELGGLGLMDWDVFNKALLGKWRWRLLVDHQSVWGRVVRAKYKIPTQFDQVIEAGNCSSWWKDIIRTCFQGEGDCWFNNGLRKELGDGRKTLFWQDIWVGHQRLCEQFRHLYILSVQRSSCISEMGHWEQGVWSWNLLWRRNLLAREEEKVGDLLTVLQQANLTEDKGDKWTWLADSSGSFTVKSAYVFMQGFELEESIMAFEHLWKGLAPSNVLVFAWKVLRGRVQSKHNLNLRGALSHGDSVTCVLCENAAKT